MIDRNTCERERLRAKRLDPVYLAHQRRARAAQMRITRAKRKAAGRCRECERKALTGFAYCRKHLLYARNRESK